MPDGQTLIVYGIVAAAVLYLARRAWGLAQARATKCGGCHGCGSSSPGPGPQLVSLGGPTRPAGPRTPARADKTV